MTEAAKLLLERMASECDKTGNNKFDSSSFFRCPNTLIEELESNGYVEQKHNIIGTVILTDAGYAKASH